MRRIYSLLFFILMSCFSVVNGQIAIPITWTNTNGSSSLKGIADLGGTIGLVTATVTITTNVEPKYGKYNSNTNPSNDIGYTGNNASPKLNNADTPSIRTALGISDNLNWFFTYKGPTGYPKVVTIQFDKNVVVSKLAMTDLEQKVDTGGGWSENFTISGYNFDSYVSSNFKQKGPITTSVNGVYFGDTGMTDVDSPNNVGTMLFAGSKTLEANKNLVVKFDGTTSYTTNAGTNVSNEANPFAIFLSAPCTPPATPAVSTAAATCSSAGTATISNYNSNYTYAFSPSGPSVGSGGIISNMTAGTSYTVTASSGGCTSAASQSFSVQAQLPTPTISGNLNAVVGGTSQLTGSGIAASSSPWVSSNTNVATVSSSGLVTGVSDGTTTITYTNSSGCKATATFTVTTPIPAGSCNTIPSPQFSANSPASATLNGVTVTRSMTNPKYSTALTKNSVTGNYCQNNYAANYAYLFAEGTSGAQSITYTFSAPQTSVEVFLLLMGNDEANTINPMDQADFTVGGSSTGFTLSEVGNFDCQNGVTIKENSVIADYKRNNSTTDAAIRVYSATPFTSITITNPHFGLGNTSPVTGTNGVGYLVELCPASLSPVCYKPATTTGMALATQHGITALQRAGANNGNWPMVRKGAWTALEANTKGFVPNRLTDAQVAAIPAANLKKGMMVYNMTQNCLQINTDGTSTGWKCFNTQGCPTVN